jgi:hypothetical protein
VLSYTDQAHASIEVSFPLDCRTDDGARYRRKWVHRDLRQFDAQYTYPAIDHGLVDGQPLWQLPVQIQRNKVIN